MILYTLMPLEVVLDGFDKPCEYKEVEVNGIKLLIEPLELNRAKIVRMISTDPQDYLNPDYSPGKIIQFKV
jgi:ABC-type antimicrobial peptide transport system ATPase subunit